MRKKYPVFLAVAFALLTVCAQGFYVTNIHDTTTWKSYDIDMNKTTIVHELGHAISIPHHTNGTLGCVMFQPCENKYSPPSEYCTSNSDCKTKSQLH